ncbi:NAD(P)-dependent alcohol dehydrogenase, partial [Aliarcobacter butzleri]
IVGGVMPGGRLRSEKLVSLIQSKRIRPKKFITHTFNGMEHIEEALHLMKDKPRDLIKPVVII